MQDSEQVRERKRRSSRAVLAGVSLMGMALLLSGLRLAPDIATTAGAITGFALLMYGVHVGWLIFYEREPQGPSS